MSLSFGVFRHERLYMRWSAKRPQLCCRFLSRDRMIRSLNGEVSSLHSGSHCMLKYLSLVIMLTLLSCGTASAEWMKVGGTHKYDGFVDMAAIGPTGHRVTL